MAGTGNTSIRSYNFFATGAIAGAGAVGLYAENLLEFVDLDDGTPFTPHSIMIVNDGAADINFRFAADPGGGASHGAVKTTEPLQLDFKRSRRLYLSGTVAGSGYRVWAW
jgi:hypothetical protein